MPALRAGAFAGLSGRIRELQGWRRYALSFSLGVGAVLALPPLHVLPVLLISFCGLVFLMDGAERWRDAFKIGWWFGFGYFVTGLYWVAFALMTDPGRFGWMIPFAVGGLSALLAVFPGLALLFTFLTKVTGPGRIFIFAAAWTATEWARGILFTGFPWNPIGNAWTVSEPMIQFASVAGVYGLSLVTVVVAAIPAILADDGSRRWIVVGGVAAGLAVIWAGGAMRLGVARADVVPNVVLRLVQPNISQVRKWRDDLRAAQLAKHLRLSTSGGSMKVTHVIWPETAAPFFLANEPRLRRLMASVVPRNGYLITGALRTTAVPARPFKAWNSLHAIDQNGNIVATYDKFHLVPFGEYVPLRSVLDIAKVTAGTTDFSAGPGPRSLRLAGLPPVGPLICYEAIFPGAVTESGFRPQWLLNVTNDAWFGRTAGPHQHFASARMRAVEEGIPLVRVANTGISGVIDAYGRVTARLGLDVEGVLDAQLPVATSTPTLYGRLGDGVLLFLVIVATLGGLLPHHGRSLHMG